MRARPLAVVPLTLALGALSAATLGLPSSAATPRVLRVGTWDGIRGTFSSIQAAVEAAHAGAWVLIEPGDYKEHGDFTTQKPNKGEPGWGVRIATPGLHVRGMN